MASISVAQDNGVGGAAKAHRAPLIELRDLVVEFGAQRALDKVSLSIQPGEIIGLVGANGAGKSTLGRVLVGEIPVGGYSGAFDLRGEAAQFTSARHAHEAGIMLVHQEGAAIDQLSIGENVMLTIEPTRRGFIDWPALHGRAADALRRLKMHVDTEQRLGDHGGVALMELVEIARSIIHNGQVFMFDESTAALGVEEVRTLFECMRELSAGGAAIIFISHHLQEVLAVCDRVIVLRDGRKVLDAPRADHDQESIITAMLGTTDIHFHSRSEDTGAVGRRTAAFSVRNWRVEKSAMSRVALGPIAFDLGRGEILGVYGPLGAGKSELLQSLFGLITEGVTGECLSAGITAGPPADAREALRRGLALVSAERQKEGMFPELSVLENMMVGYHNPGLSWRQLLLRHDHAAALCARLIEALGIKTNGPSQAIKDLSGGNQQKVLLARALINSPTVLLLDEPTRGIDVGAKQDVYRWIRKIATEGTMVVVSSLEEGELIGLADRILVLREGRQVTILDGQSANDHMLAALAAGGTIH